VRVKEATGCTMLLIEHDMPLVTSVADELIALEIGRIIARGRPGDVTNDARVVEAYLGTDQRIIARSGGGAPELVDAEPAAPAEPEEPVEPSPKARTKAAKAKAKAASGRPARSGTSSRRKAQTSAESASPRRRSSSTVDGAAPAERLSSSEDGSPKRERSSAKPPRH